MSGTTIMMPFNDTTSLNTLRDERSSNVGARSR